MARMPDLHHRVARTWECVRSRLRFAGSRRWRVVKGPIASTIATLLDVGWGPRSPMEWISDQDLPWRVPSFVDAEFDYFHGDFTNILDDTEDSVGRQLWATASLHDAGAVLRDGAD
eukprot:5908449-Pyramimonas_sp.AAC.1